MIRRIVILSSLLVLLTGCVTTREVVYRDGYRENGQSDNRYYSDETRYAGGSDGYYDERYSGGSVYAPATSGRGDYYYSRPSYASSYPSWYVDYPAYYSLFWGLNRSWYDPFSYPNYYYGVTYYPRNYFSISFNSGWGGSHYGHYGYQYYSPYRYSWVDNYYDWSPWHNHHYSHNRYHQPTPRYGSARNEAERLSRMSDRNAYYGQNNGGSYGGQRDRGLSNPDRRETAFGTYGTARDGSRAADYGSRSAPRQDPGTRGFGVPTDGGSDAYRDVRRNAAYGTPGATRQDPGTRGFGVPVDGNGRDYNQDSRIANYGAPQPRALPSARGFGVENPQIDPRNAMPAQNGYPRDARYGAQREVGRYGNEAMPNDGSDARARFEREPRQRGYEGGVALPDQIDRGIAPRAASGYERTRSTPVTREYSRPAMPSRSYEAEPSVDRGYRMPARESYSEAPPRGYAPAPEAQSYSAPSRGYDAGASAPSYSAPEPAPQYESRSESRSDSDDGGVRRVGNNRDE